MLCSQRIILTVAVAATMSIFSVAHGQCASCGGGSGPVVAAPVVVGPAFDQGYATTYSDSYDTGGCASGGCASGGCASGGCSSGGCGGGAASSAGFGYAGGGCPGGNCGGGAGFGGGCSGAGCLANIKAGRADIASQLDQIHQRSERIRKRNAAWMKPFACADRQAYESIWNRHYQSGRVQVCTLTDQHFDLKTGQLNGLGTAIVQGVMKNSPRDEKNIYVYTGPGKIDYDSKVQVVNSMITNYYGAGSAQIAATSTNPKSASGIRAELKNQQFYEGTPPPRIIIPTATGSTSDTQAAAN